MEIKVVSTRIKKKIIYKILIQNNAVSIISVILNVINTTKQIYDILWRTWTQFS